ncbi:MAG: 4Fe-4S binding protein [Thermodesulfobacteriota bacterium]|nr:4Fe-4S binding protein [Thermodesulfobacteriota bacterium]
MYTNLSTTFLGVPVNNPLVSGAGPQAGTVNLIKKYIDAGFGAVCTKTASQFEYYHKYPYTRYHLVGYEKAGRGRAFRDWVWFHNDHNAPVGPEKFAKTIAQVSDYAREKNCLLIGTFAASSVDEWARCAERYQKAGAGALELNFCCPGPATLKDVIKKDDMTARFGDMLAEDTELSCEIVRKVRGSVDIPILCKLPPILRAKSKEFASALYQAGANGVELYANNKGMRIDIENAAPVAFGCGTVNTHGHLAETIYDVTQIVMSNPKINIMAGRGVRRWEEVVELLMVGASAVEICTTTLVYGVDFGQEILSELSRFLSRKQYVSVDDLRGRALKKVLKPSEIKEKVTPVVAKVLGDKCSSCGRCEEVCAYEAATVFYKAGHGVAKINESKCVGCTLCHQICPENAITLKDRTDEEYLRALMSRHPEV